MHLPCGFAGQGTWVAVSAHRRRNRKTEIIFSGFGTQRELPPRLRAQLVITGARGLLMSDGLWVFMLFR